MASNAENVSTWWRHHVLYREVICQIFCFNHIWINLTSTAQGYSWWRHQMETFSALLAICAGNSPASGEFPAQRPVTRSFDVFFDLCLNERLRKQSWGWWFETLLCPVWRHCNDQDKCAYTRPYNCCWDVHEQLMETKKIIEIIGALRQTPLAFKKAPF